MESVVSNGDALVPDDVVARPLNRSTQHPVVSTGRVGCAALRYVVKMVALNV
jgi:hypothetical protein